MSYDIQKILQQGEGLQVEFKTSFTEEVAETLVAFANASGGAVYIGVANNSAVKGIALGKETIQNWINEVKNKTSLQIIPNAEVLKVDGKAIVKLSVAEYPVKPVSIRGRYFKRVSNANHLMSIDEISNEHLRTINSSWDYFKSTHVVAIAHSNKNKQTNNTSIKRLKLNSAK